MHTNLYTMTVLLMSSNCCQMTLLLLLFFILWASDGFWNSSCLSMLSPVSWNSSRTELCMPFDVYPYKHWCLDPPPMNPHHPEGIDQTSHCTTLPSAARPDLPSLSVPPGRHSSRLWHPGGRMNFPWLSVNKTKATLDIKQEDTHYCSHIKSHSNSLLTCFVDKQGQTMWRIHRRQKREAC